MTKTKFVIPLLSGAIALFTLACSAADNSNEVVPAVPQQDTVEAAAPTEIDPVVEPQPEVKVETNDSPMVEVPAEVEAAPDAAVDTTAATEKSVADIPASDSEEVAQDVALESVPFNAVIGLDSFSAYRLAFEATFAGQRNGQPTAGTLAGLFEVTRNPEAQHWQVSMAGDMFNQFAALGSNTIELYDLGETVYIQNPQDGGFIGMPAFLVDSMLPADIYTPEENISLPLTAVPQPGEEVVNGVTTRRYTFGSDDLPVDDTAYEAVEGTIWVALDGNYVVKYQSTVTGHFDNMATAGIELLDEGTVHMVYNLTDANGGFTIDAPAGATALDLGKLLFN